MRIFLLFILMGCCLQDLWAQERCGIVAYEAHLHKNNPNRETIQQFENWIQKINASPSKFKSQAKNQTQSTYTIPVVVHIIHNGESIGTGVNISDAQIQSQINVLNNDFNRLNADRTNTPAAFQSVAGTFDIQFVLAKQDPSGLATTGIRRVKGSQTSWSISDNFLLKSQSYWPTEDYLNIWVCNLTGYLGYTQFPVSNLPGLENSSNERLTDGIVIHYREFGSVDDGAFDLDTRYNKGRTLTHEMGHFFGLRHIWGDGSDCTTTDYVADTPTQSSSTSGCPSHPRLDCGSPQQPRMFQNYLDYTNDACMNLFTQGQVSRMTTVLQNSIRRASLLTSLGSLPPSSLPNDLGIKNVVSPLATQCSGSFTPAITIRNYGTNTITSAQVELRQNGVVVETLTPSLNLLIAQETQISFSLVTLSPGSNFTFTYTILQTNGGTDSNATNNVKSIVTSIPFNAPALPLQENFSSLSGNWGIVNPDGLTTWQSTTTPDGRTAAYMNFYDYTEIGASDLLTSPVLDLTTSTKATLIFDRAYAPYPGVTGERLRVLVSNNCNFSTPTVAFSKSDEDLATTEDDYNSFAPVNATQWKTEVVDLSAYVGSKIQLAFEGTSANGNNIYITNVRIVNSDWVDLALIKVSQPSPVVCSASIAPILLLRNVGNVAINSFTASVSLNGQAEQPQVFNFLLNVNEEKSFSFNTLTLAQQLNTLGFTLSQPNGIADNVATNNSISYKVVVNDTKNIIPLRERFDSDTKNNWSIISQGQQAAWQLKSTNYQNSLAYNCFTNAQLGDESWLVSPVLNFTSLQHASIFFNVSYAQAQKGIESLRMMASTDCGLSFSETLYHKSGSNLASLNNNSAWLPASAADWKKEFIDLTPYTGKPNMRFAFIATNGNGNNLFLDNIDFYTDNNANPIVPDELFWVYGGGSTDIKITFNLDTRTDARWVVYNTVGQVVSEYNYQDVLNQTYPIDLGERSQGIYLVKVQIGNQVFARKVFFGGP